MMSRLVRESGPEGMGPRRYWTPEAGGPPASGAAEPSSAAEQVPYPGRVADGVRRELRLDKTEQIEAAVPSASRAFRRIYEAYFGRRLGVTLTQALVIGQLDLERSHVLNQTEIARRVGVRKTAIGAALDALIVRGYVDRISDPADGRAKLLSLTEKGVELGRDVDDAFGELAAASRRDTTSDERRALVTTLDTMRRNLEDLEAQILSEQVGSPDSSTGEPVRRGGR
jgi:MarR family transcriptional regulator, transcriptional regulator for hemolysin